MKILVCDCCGCSITAMNNVQTYDTAMLYPVFKSVTTELCYECLTIIKHQVTKTIESIRDELRLKNSSALDDGKRVLTEHQGEVQGDGQIQQGDNREGSGSNNVKSRAIGAREFYESSASPLFRSKES